MLNNDALYQFRNKKTHWMMCPLIYVIYIGYS